MIDVWSSAGVGLPRQMPQQNGNIPLPIDEATFLNWRREINLIPVQEPDRKSSLLGHMVKLNRILITIHDVLSKIVSQEYTKLVVSQRIQELSQKLDDWYFTLPSYMLDTPENLKNYTSYGLGRMFVAVYLGYYHFGQLLFYPFLHDGSRGIDRHYADRCKNHAANLCSIVYRAHETPGCEVWYSMVGHILVVSSTVQIHTLLFNTNEVEVSMSRTRLEQNFKLLTRFKTFWPTLDTCLSRLWIFHRVCRTGSDSSFRLDEWMIRFLSEYAKPVEEKFDDNLQLLALTSLEVGMVEQV